MNEQTLKEQEQFLEGTVSVREVLAFLDQDHYLNLAQASEYLGISTRTIRDRDDIPRYRVGKKILLFKKSELDEWLSQFREGGKAELDELVNETLAKVI
jgi:excisionase family DNA binding protein